jgi:hypothetical protein
MVLLHYETNGSFDDVTSPLSHAALMVYKLNEMWAEY